MLAVAVASLGGATRRSNRALALVLFLFSVCVGAVVAEHAAWPEAVRVLVLIEYTVSLLFPTALWHYANTVLDTRSRVPLWVHLLPAGLWLGYLGAVGFLGLGVAPFRVPPILALVVYLAGYTVAVAFRVWRAPLSRVFISHGMALRALVGLLFLLHGAQVIRYVFREVPALVDIVPLTSTFIVYAVSVVAVRQSRLFAGLAPPAGRRRKYEASTLTPARAKEIARRLQLVMERDKPFTDEQFNLADLAARLGVPRAHLSQVINAEIGSSFPQWLNAYRVREAARLLTDPALAHLTIEAIGYEVGFRSRSGFHSAFRRITGQTPAGVRAQLS